MDRLAEAYDSPAKVTYIFCSWLIHMFIIIIILFFFAFASM
jgi:hypothetical protein